MYNNLTRGLRIVLYFPAVSIIRKGYFVLKKEIVKEKENKIHSIGKSSKTS